MEPDVQRRLGQLLVSLQLTDSAFPSGFYTMSHGLEGFHQAKLVDATTVQDLLVDLLRHSVAPGDGAALALAHRAATEQDWERVSAVDRHLYASKLNAELRLASRRSGRQVASIASLTFAEPAIAHWDDLIRSGQTPGCQPVVTGVINAALGVSVEEAVAADIFAFSASYAGAALRLRLVDHRTSQVMLAQVAPVIEEATRTACQTSLEEVGGFVPLGDIASGQHERAEARLFTS